MPKYAILIFLIPSFLASSRLSRLAAQTSTIATNNGRRTFASSFNSYLKHTSWFKLSTGQIWDHVILHSSYKLTFEIKNISDKDPKDKKVRLFRNILHFNGYSQIYEINRFPLVSLRPEDFTLHISQMHCQTGQNGTEILDNFNVMSQDILEIPESFINSHSSNNGEDRKNGATTIFRIEVDSQKMVMRAYVNGFLYKEEGIKNFCGNSIAKVPVYISSAFTSKFTKSAEGFVRILEYENLFSNNYYEE